MKRETRFRFRAGAIMLAAIAALAAASPFLDRGGGTAGERLDLQLAPPGGAHPLGCDEGGRDLLAAIAKGAVTALLVGVLTVLATALPGTVIGAFAGYAGGPADELLMRVVDMLMSFPGVLLAIGITASSKSPSHLTVVAALAVTGWVPYARLARSEARTLRGRDFVLAARVMGSGPVRNVFTHLLPNMMAPIVVQMTAGMASAVLAEASLSFLGLGPPNAGSWGALMDQGVQYITIRWHLAVFPGIAISAMVLGLNLLGDGLRDMLDPRMKAI
jgi:peptide/nickel transport system permease protein